MAFDIDRYAHVASPLQSWDPRVKVASLGLLILVIALLKTIPMAVVAIAIAIGIMALSALPLHFVSHGLSFVLMFLIPFFFIMPFTYPGEGAFEILGVSFAWQGLRIATLIFIKALSIVMLSFVIFGSSRFDISMLALQRLKFPSIVVQMLLFAYRYTFVFLDEMKRMHISMRARGFIARSDRKTLKIYGHFIGTLLVRSFERTERVYKAMLSKGYQGKLHSMVQFHSVPLDYAKAAVILLITIGLLIGEFGGTLNTAVQAWY